MKKIAYSLDADWNARVLFLRSKANPQLCLLSKYNGFSSPNADHASLFDSVDLANDLLRIDLHSFFTEMAGWHLYYRKCRPAYILSEDAPNIRHLSKLDVSDHGLFHKRTAYWKRLELAPYVDRVEGSKFRLLTFPDRHEYARWRDSQPPLSPGFCPAINSALEHSSSGSISTSTKHLLMSACSICLTCNGSRLPDPFYYSYLFGTIAAECSEINGLLALICADKNLIQRYDAAGLFSSYLSLEKCETGRIAKISSFELTEEPSITTYNPTSSFSKFFKTGESSFLISHDLDYLQSLYAAILQTCLNIDQKTHSVSEGKTLDELKDQTIRAYIDASNMAYRGMAQELDSVINLCSKVLSSLRIWGASEKNRETLIDLLSELQTFRDSEYFRTIDQFSNINHLWSQSNVSVDLILKTREILDHFKRLTSSKTRGPLVRNVALNDTEASLEQIKRHAIIRHAKNTCLFETEWSFSKFYARLLSELLNCGKIPIRCKSCGSLFFPTGSNSQYCDRLDPTTNLYCNPRLNEKKRLGRKAPHGTAINLHKKAETAKQFNEKRRHAYFAELEEFVDHEIGPVYFKSTLITDELYQSWRAAINTPKNQPRTKTPEQLGFPHPVIWEDQIIDGNQKIAVYLNQYAYPALRDKLDQSAKSSKSSCTVIDKPTICFGGWILCLFDLLRLIASINNDEEHVQDGPVPIPGLGPMGAYTPDRSPLKPWPKGRERFLHFPSSGKESFILFEIIDEERSKQLQMDLTHAAPRPQPKEFQWQYPLERQE